MHSTKQESERIWHRREKEEGGQIAGGNYEGGRKKKRGKGCKEGREIERERERGSRKQPMLTGD